MPKQYELRVTHERYIVNRFWELMFGQHWESEAPNELYAQREMEFLFPDVFDSIRQDKDVTGLAVYELTADEI